MRKVCHIRFYPARPLAAFTVCAAVLCAAYAIFGLYPFGGKTLSWCDMSQQVIPLMMELKDVLSGRSGWFLNLQNAGGMSFWGVFFFFLASPLHLSALLVDKAGIYMLVNVLVLIKLSLAALTSSVFFQREAPGLTMPANLALSVGYGLCGYGLMYYQNLVWLDMLYMFPLTMLGFVRLTEEGRAGLLTMCLTLSIAMNYYLSYMLLLGMVICGAVFLRTCAPKERRGELAGKLGAAAMTALLLTAVIWVPSLLQCLASARTGGGTVRSVRSGRLLTDLRTSLPVLLCTIGAAGVPFLGRSFPKSPKTRAVTLCWALTALPMVIEPINKLWHMGSYQAFPVRYGYMPVFFGLWRLGMGLDSTSEKAAGRWWTAALLAAPVLTGVYVLWSGFVEISSYTSTLWVSTEGFMYLGLFWLACLGALWGICRAGMRGRTASWALLGLTLVQAAVQIPAFVGSAANLPEKSLAVLSAPHIEDDGLYRVKLDSKFVSVNLLGGMGYPTLNHYTSLTDRRYLAAIKKLGYSSYWMETSGCCGTLVSDMLMSNKYVLDSGLGWTSTGGGDLGYILPAGALPESMELGGRVELQDELCRALTGETLFTRYEPVEGQTVPEGVEIWLEPGTLRYQISAGRGETLYFDAFDCISTSLREAINDGFSVRVNGEVIAQRYPTQRCNGILRLGSFEGGPVTVEVTVHKRMRVCSFGVWGLKDTGPLESSLVNAELRYEDGGISGSAEAGEGQALFLSVPMYGGTRVEVNGWEVRPRQVLDCFMEIPLPPGHSEIRVTCVPAGMLAGGAVSAAAAVLLMLRPLLRRRRPMAAVERLWDRCAPALLGASFIAAILAVYLLPPVLWATKFI